MNEDPQQVSADGAKRDSHDGLAALAIVVLAILLIAFVISQII